MRHLLVLATGLLAACGQQDPSVDQCDDTLGEEYLPLVVGAEWIYDAADATHDLPPEEKINRVVEKVGSIAKIENQGSGTSPGFRWLEHDQDRYVWQRNLYFNANSGAPESDQYYDPPALRFDASRAVLGESWVEPPYEKRTIDIATCPDWDEDLGVENLDSCPEESITSKSVQETWTVVAVDEPLSEVQADLDPDHTPSGGVPAGDFEVLCHRRECDPGSCIAGTYCFARGVGKVWELSDDREELTSFCFPPGA